MLTRDEMVRKVQFYRDVLEHCKWRGENCELHMCMRCREYVCANKTKAEENSQTDI